MEGSESLGSSELLSEELSLVLTPKEPERSHAEFWVEKCPKPKGTARTEASIGSFWKGQRKVGSHWNLVDKRDR